MIRWRSTGTLLALLLLITVVAAALRSKEPLRNRFLRAMMRVRPGTAEVARQQRGYYENLAAAGRMNFQGGEVFPQWYLKCVIPGTPNSIMVPSLDDWRKLRARENAQLSCFGDIPWRTDERGFRGPAITEKPAEGTTRIAVMGASYVTGFGVAAEEAFPAVMDRLLAEKARNGRKFEVVNAGMNAHTPVDQTSLVREVVKLHPHLVVYIAHENDPRLIARQVRSPSPIFRLDDLRVSRLPPALRERFVAARKAPLPEATREILTMIGISDQLIVEALRDANVRAAWTRLPEIGPSFDAEDIEPFPAHELDDHARRAGFTVLDTQQVYQDYDLIDLWVHEWDAHPTPLGHRLIAEALIRELDRAKLLD